MLLLWICLSLAASFLLPATGEVVSSFDSCSQFFLGGKPPNLVPMNPARICQFYKNSYQFATMYDKDWRIPLFSAYKYQFENGDRQMDWMIEPQLALPWDQQCKNMESEQDSGIDPQELAKSQAVSKDYAGVLSYIKGQLAPFSHQPAQDSKDATFTLTNAVPQFKDLANGYWKQYLSNMKRDADGCSETYVITGAVLGEDSISGGRVNKPSFIWAAVCCVKANLHKTSWGVIADNTWNNLDRLSLRQLEQNLQVKYRKPINLFNGACYAYE